MDIRINSISAGSSASGVRNMIAYVKVRLRPQLEHTRSQFDIQDLTTGSGIETHMKQFFGTALFQDVYHNWNLPSKDHFTYSVEDLREDYGLTKIDFSAMQSIPHVVGVDNNRIRIWASDCMNLTRTDPRLWVDTDGGDMGKTRLVDRSSLGPQNDNPFKHLSEETIELAPYYAIKIYEITDLSVVALQKKTTDMVQ
jgi:hypothetical protein